MNNLSNDFETNLEFDSVLNYKKKINSKTLFSITSETSKDIISIFITSTIGKTKTEKISINRNTSVKEIKEKISSIFGISVDDFYLFFNKKNKN